MIDDHDAQQRSVAATLLGDRGITISIASLCERLSIEKSLYSKIAITNSLAKFGPEAIVHLEKYIGKIDKNQHEKLPEDIFKKKNYPLPRDIVIRTIIRMEEQALPYLQRLLNTDNTSILSEVIDCIGHITFYSKNYSVLDDLLTIFDNSEKSEVLRWKVIRSFQSFPQQEVVSRLKDVLLESQIPAHRWEAVRSLAQINTKETRLLASKGLSDSHPLVVEMAKVSKNF